jgi:hypothetical protein
VAQGEGGRRQGRERARESGKRGAVWHREREERQGECAHASSNVCKHGQGAHAPQKCVCVKEETLPRFED